MSNEKQIRVMQFAHPGAEHSRGKKIKGTDLWLKPWNTGSHKRKYVRCNAQYIAQTSSKKEELKSGIVDFWAEWEPESIQKKIHEPSENNEKTPRYINYPIYISDIIRKKYNLIHQDQLPTAALANTDPFVFGDKFYYTCCKQESTKNLKEGSIILFGSVTKKPKEKFLIDTVFVIGKIIDPKKDKDEYKKAIKEIGTDSIFYNTVLKLLKGGNCNSPEFRLIIGATYDAPYSNGTYSFFPCKPSFKAPVEKFALNADIGDESISTSLRNVKYVTENSEQEVVNYWNYLKKKCFSEGYSLGVKAELPQNVQSLDADNLLKLVQNVDNKIDKLV